ISHPVLASIHVHPLKAAQGHAPGEAVVEPWGLAGDRRWMLVDEAARAVTQRTYPRLALTAAEQLPGGGLRVSAPGREALTVPVPHPPDTIAVQIWRDKVEALLGDE